MRSNGDWGIGLLARLPTHRALLAGIALVCAAYVWQTALAGAEWGGEPFWNEIRASRAYAAVHGVDMYASADEGVLPGHLYGPVGFFAYAPVALANTPGDAIQWGILLSWLFVLLPFGGIVFARCGMGVLPACLILLAVLHFRGSPAAAGLRIVHIDAPATALVLLSFAALWRALDRPGKRRWLIAAAAAAAAAAWTKQTTAPALVLPALVLWWAGRRRDAAWALGATVLSGLVLGTAFGWMYGVSDLWWTMFAVPAQHARHPGLLLMDSTVVGGLLDLLPFAAILLFLRSDSETEKPSAAALAGLYALALLPLAALGRLKVSGDPNNYLGPDVFLTLSLCLAVGAALGTTKAPRRRPALALLGLLLTVQAAQTTQAAAFTAYLRATAPVARPSDEAFAFLKRHPGRAYFPDNPLTMHMAEGRLFHTGHGAVTRAQAGYPVSNQQWRAHVPEGARWLIVPTEPRGELLEQMPEYAVRIENPELPGWIVFERAGATGE